MGVQRLQGQLLNRGFTLVELVAVILIAGIILVVSTRFIGHSISGYADANSRSQVTAAGRAAMERMGLELRDALPGSLRVTDVGGGGQCLEFLPVIAGTRYLNPAFADDSVGKDAFDVVDFGPAPEGDVLAAIYPIDTAELYRPSNPGPLAGPLAAVEDPDPGDGKLTVRLEEEEEHQFTRRSPQQRLFLTRYPVSFCITGSKLYRYQDYDLHETQCLPTSCPSSQPPDRSLLANGLDEADPGAFQWHPSTLQRNALVSITLNIRQRDEGIQLRQDIMVRNVP